MLTSDLNRMRPDATGMEAMCQTNMEDEAWFAPCHSDAGAQKPTGYQEENKKRTK